MNDKQVKLKLHVLKSIKPETNTLHEIHGKVFSNIPQNVHRNRAKWLHLPFFIPVVSSIALAIMIFILGGFFSTIVLYTKIAMTPDQHEKAQIAFAYAQETLSEQEKNSNKVNNNTYETLSQSVEIANAQMSQLKLKGEKGKYTQHQCLTLYHEYYKYLQQLKRYTSSKATNSNSLQTRNALLSEINTFDEQAEIKLHMYKDKE